MISEKVSPGKGDGKQREKREDEERKKNRSPLGSNSRRQGSMEA